MSHWVEDLADRHARDEPCVVITLVAIEGSSPREPGAKMIVGRETASGTLGGGTVEHIAEQRARSILEQGPQATAPVLEEFVLNDAIDQACGGRMRLLFEPVWPAPLHVALFGAGHVGQALVRALDGVPCRVRWVDSRPEVFPERIPPFATKVVSERPQDEISKIPEGAFVIVMTHSHDTDLEIVEAALRSPRPAFIGTIGSKTKRARFRGRLAERGLEEAARDRLTIPIGIAGVGGKRPAEIAIAIAAQLLQLRDEGVQAQAGPAT